MEERFVTAYFRFNDDTFTEMLFSAAGRLRATAFLSQWNETARSLAGVDALRLLATFSKLRPVVGRTSEDSARAGPSAEGVHDRFLHAHLQGLRLGAFDLYFDEDTPEQVWAGQSKTAEGTSFYDVLTSFSIEKLTQSPEAVVNGIVGESGMPIRS